MVAKGKGETTNWLGSILVFGGTLFCVMDRIMGSLERTRVVKKIEKFGVGKRNKFVVPLLGVEKYNMLPNKGKLAPYQKATQSNPDCCWVRGGCLLTEPRHDQMKLSLVYDPSAIKI